MKILIKIAVVVLNVIYIPFKMCKTKNLVTMISRESDEIPVDFQLLKDEINRRDSSIDVVVLCKKIGGGIGEKIKYAFEILKQMKYIAQSKVVVIDTYCIPVSVLKHKETIKFVQIWHSCAAIKKFGYQTIGKSSGSSKVVAEGMKMHCNYDYVTAPSIATGKLFAEGFNVSEDKIKIIGLPRIDYIKTGGEIPKETFVEKYPQLLEKENILYAPTFRRGKGISLQGVVDAVDFNKYNLVVKLHPLDKADIEGELTGVILDTEFSTFEWMKMCGKVISDYSAVGLESTLQDKEVYFYLYDEEEYCQTTGMNMDFSQEEVAVYVARTPDELKDVLNVEYDKDKMRIFRDKYFQVENCTATMAEFLMNLM